MRRNDEVVLLFIKAPLRGLVKSRLAEAVGNEAALELYKNFVLDAIETLRGTSYPLRLCCFPPDSGGLIREWLGPEFSLVAQQGRDLGERMNNAFELVFSQGFTRAVLVGSDIPDLSGSILQEAFSALRRSDAVLGPATDGGYYLIGFRNTVFLPAAFQGIPWGTRAVFRETKAVLESNGLSLSFLPELRDQDTLADLEEFFFRKISAPCAASRTMAYLMRHCSRFFPGTMPAGSE